MAVLLVLFHRATVPVVLGVVVASNVVACAVGAAVAIRSLRKETQTANLKVGALFSYGMRSLPGTTGPIEAFSLDQVAVGLLLSRSDLGLYVVAGAFNNLPSILVSGVGTIALPRISAERDPTARTRAIRKIGMLSVAMAAATSLVAELLVGSLLPLAFGADFASAVPIARLLILAGLLFAVRRMLVVFLQAVGRPGRTAVGEAASFIVLATLALALVPVWGVIGASIAVISAAGAGNVYLLWALTRADHEAIAAPTAGVGAQPRRSRP
jgi:O-antigen/teichoic acid export membrane protein